MRRDPGVVLPGDLWPWQASLSDGRQPTIISAALGNGAPDVDGRRPRVLAAGRRWRAPGRIEQGRGEAPSIYTNARDQTSTVATGKSAARSAAPSHAHFHEHVDVRLGHQFRPSPAPQPARWSVSSTARQAGRSPPARRRGPGWSRPTPFGGEPAGADDEVRVSRSSRLSARR